MFDNTVTRAIEVLTPRIEALAPDALARVEATADAPDPILRQMMAEKHAAGRLPLSEAQTLYAIAEDWSNQPLAARVVWYTVAGELMGVSR